MVWQHKFKNVQLGCNCKLGRSLYLVILTVNPHVHYWVVGGRVMDTNCSSGAGRKMHVMRGMRNLGRHNLESLKIHDGDLQETPFPQT